MGVLLTPTVVVVAAAAGVVVEAVAFVVVVVEFVGAESVSVAKLKIMTPMERPVEWVDH